MSEIMLPQKPWDVGFSGTQDGMTDEQALMFEQAVMVFQPVTFHHGVCEGADEEAHFIVRRILPNCKIIGHPGVRNNGQVWKRSKKAQADLDECLPSKPFLDRNEDIIKAVNFLVATPKEKEPQQRSGTWSTIRRAQWNKTWAILLVHRDGTMEIEYADD